jgi:hypothetical protein
MTPDEEQTIRRYQQKAPVDVTALATSLGLSVYETYDLPPGVSGMIARDSSPESASGYSISVNGNEPYRRRRFTIAHEFAHYLLHRSQIGDEISDDAMYRSEKLTSRDEFAANNLAADLLMPRELVKKYVKQGHSSISELANMFDVSEPAMRVRMRYLYSA